MIHLNTTIFFLIAHVSLCEESPQVGASHPYNIDHNENHKSKGGKETHARARVAAMTRTQVKNQAHNHSAASSQLNKCSNLKSNDLDACLRSLGVLGCSMEAWCSAPCA
jgi:predicted ATPase with chaperone activity